MNSARLLVLTGLLATTLAAQTPPPTVTLIYSGIVDPYVGLLRGPNGVLYETTESGGAGAGTIYDLVPPATAGAAWTENVLHTFRYFDGAYPQAALILDKRGNLYGTATEGGASGTFRCTL